MNKAELTRLVAQRGRLSRPQAARAVQATLDLIAESLADGGEINLAGFGRFHVAARRARAAAHPRTGEPIWVGDMLVPRFTAGSGLKQAVRR